MLYGKKVADLMISLEDYPHVPDWFTLRQAMAIIREAAIKFAGVFQPRSVLIFNEKYQLQGILTLRDIIRGLAPELLRRDAAKLPALPDLDAALPVLEAELFGPGAKEASQTPVAALMAPIKATVETGDSLARALLLMFREDLGRLPVMEEQKVVGIIRLSDLFREISDFILAD